MRKLGKLHCEGPFLPALHPGVNRMVDEIDHNADKGIEHRARFVLVPIGIVLFALGFVMTAVSVTGGTVIGEPSHPAQHLFLLSGIAMSLAGVVAATAGPASFLLHHKKRSR